MIHDVFECKSCGNVFGFERSSSNISIRVLFDRKNLKQYAKKNRLKRLNLFQLNHCYKCDPDKSHKYDEATLDKLVMNQWEKRNAYNQMMKPLLVKITIMDKLLSKKNPTAAERQWLYDNTTAYHYDDD